MPLTRPTTTPLPDEIYDLWAPQLGEAELKVLLYIVRRTLGFRKEADAISLTQFTRGIVTGDGRVLDHGCGVKNRSNVVRALKSLEGRGLIRATSRRTAAGDQGVTTYALWWEGDEADRAAGGGGPAKGPGGSTAAGPGWSRSGHKVVPQQDCGSAVAGPTTNSTTTNSQQNSETTGDAPSDPEYAYTTQRSRTLAPGAITNGDAVWQAVRAALRSATTPEHDALWCAQSRVLSDEPGHLTIGVMDRAQRHWLDVRLRRHIERALADLGQGDLQIQFEVSPP